MTQGSQGLLGCGEGKINSHLVEFQSCGYSPSGPPHWVHLPIQLFQREVRNGTLFHKSLLESLKVDLNPSHSYSQLYLPLFLSHWFCLGFLLLTHQETLVQFCLRSSKYSATQGCKQKTVWPSPPQGGGNQPFSLTHLPQSSAPYSIWPRRAAESVALSTYPHPGAGRPVHN